MPRYFTPIVRFANPRQAALKGMAQTAEPTHQVPSDHATRFLDFSGVVRFRYRPDFRKFLSINLFPPSITDAVNFTGLSASHIIPTNLPTNVSITGSNFQSGSDVFFNDVPCTNVVFLDENHMTVTAPTSVGNNEGPIDIFIIRPDYASNHNGNVLRYENPPDISSYAPVTGWMEGGDLVHVTGSYFKQGSSVSFGFGSFGSGVLSDNVTWLANTNIDFFTPVPPSGAVTATNFTTGMSVPFQIISPSSLRSANGIFYYTFHAPTGTSIPNNTGSTEGGDLVEIHGAYFNPGATVTVGTESGIPLTLVTRETGTFTTPPHASGNVSVVIVNPDGSSSLPVSFGYTGQAIPRIFVPVTSSFVTSFGVNIVKSGTVVTVSGNNYTSTLDPLVKVTSVTVGGIPAQFTIIDRRHLQFTTPQLPAMGFYDVTVSGAYGSMADPAGSAQQPANGIRFLAPPVISSIFPTSGSVLGGNQIAVTATNMLDAPEMAVSIDGISVPFIRTSPTTLVITAPSHSAGVGTIVLSHMGFVSGVSPNYTWFTATNLAGPWYPNAVG